MVFIDMSTLHRGDPAPFPTQPPRCHRCDGPSKRLITRQSNRKGNAGRPFYKCLSCDKFLAFADGRGNDPVNPPCHCGTSSKTQLAGRDKRVSRGVHYVCRLGKCDFYMPCLGRDGEQVVVVEEDLVALFAGLGIL